MATITWIMADGREIKADVTPGHTCMEAAVANNVPHIFGDCGGCLSCATCHVYVDEAWVERIGAPGDVENGMLELTDAPRQPNSRLSCQIKVKAELDGLILHVPEP